MYSIREDAYWDDDRHRLELGVFKPQRLFEDVLYLIGCERTSNLHTCTRKSGELPLYSKAISKRRYAYTSKQDT